jgi:hypothetical protein
MKLARSTCYYRRRSARLSINGMPCERFQAAQGTGRRENGA